MCQNVSCDVGVRALLGPRHCLPLVLVWSLLFRQFSRYSEKLPCFPHVLLKIIYFSFKCLHVTITRQSRCTPCRRWTGSTRSRRPEVSAEESTSSTFPSLMSRGTFLLISNRAQSSDKIIKNIDFDRKQELNMIKLKIMFFGKHYVFVYVKK